MARKGVDCPLSYDERRQFSSMIEAVGRLRGNIFNLMCKYNVDEPEYGSFARIYSDFGNLRSKMEDIKVNCL